SGIVIDGIEHQFDVVILATGFDAVTGALMKLDPVGASGLHLKDYWSDGPRTYLGLQVDGFPNLFTLGGAHVTVGNLPRGTRNQADFLTELLDSARAESVNRITVTREAVEAWTQRILDTAAFFPVDKGSWLIGGNIPGKPLVSLGDPCG